MTTHQSICTPGPAVHFPEWRGERHYMLPFTVRGGVPATVARYAGVVDDMLRTVDVDSNQECYLMIDEAVVEPGVAHRRPGLHADGYWHPAMYCHGGGGHSPRPAHHPLPAPRPRPRPRPKAEALLLASNYSACRALVGTYTRDFLARWDGGDCSTVDTSGMLPMTLDANRVYKLDVFSLHESLPVRERVQRAVVRINVPGAA